MAEIRVSMSLRKYLRLQAFQYGTMETVYVTKLDKGKVYISDGKPWINEEDITDVDFDCGYTLIPKDISKYIPIKRGESKTVKQVAKELKDMELLTEKGE